MGGWGGGGNRAISPGFSMGGNPRAFFCRFITLKKKKKIIIINYHY
jgi:hypothetical protein